jgi:hypothetical protein
MPKKLSKNFNLKNGKYSPFWPVKTAVTSNPVIRWSLNFSGIPEELDISHDVKNTIKVARKIDF